MRSVLAFAILPLVGCISSVTGTATDTQAGAYTLETVDLDSLPAPTEHSSRWVLSGFLTLQPDGYFVISERDSVWTGRAFAREEWTEGGLWMADGSSLTLSDTAAGMNDTYGAGGDTYVGSIGANTVQLSIPTDDGTAVHAYRFRR